MSPDYPGLDRKRRELEHLGNCVEALEGRLLAKIDNKPRSNWADPGSDEDV